MNSTAAGANRDGGSPRASLRKLGLHRTLSSIVLGVVSLITSAGCAYVGARLAGAMFAPAELASTDDLIGNAIRLIPALIALAVGGFLGFVVGVTVLPSLFMWGSGWNRVMPTALSIVAFEVVMLPLVIWLTARLDDTSVSAALVQSAAVVTLGGVVPALARWAVTSPTSRPATMPS